MRNFLRLTLSPDSDGTAELHAEVVSNGFSGRSSAWFNLSAIADLAAVLGLAFPLPHAVELRGGDWGRLPGEGLAEEHVALRFYPVGGRGVVGCQVRLVTPSCEDGRPEAQYRVHAELTTSYQELQRFSARLLAAVNGEGSEAVLYAAVV